MTANDVGKHPPSDAARGDGLETILDADDSNDFDGAWKDALQRYFQPFIAMVDVDIHDAIDWSRPHEFLDAELQKVARDAEVGKKRVDKLVKVFRTTGDEFWILIHVEVQLGREPNFAERMYFYYLPIRLKYQRPVLSIAVLLDRNPHWRPNRFDDRVFGSGAKFQFRIVKLTDFEARKTELERSDNPFATILLAQLGALRTKPGRDRLDWKLDVTLRLYRLGFDRQDVVDLFLFINWIMILPSELQDEFDLQIGRFEKEHHVTFITSIERKGIEQGIEQGLERGIAQGLERGLTQGLERGIEQGLERGLTQGVRDARRGAILSVLNARFGDVPPAVKERVETLVDIDALERLITVAASIADVDAFARDLPTPTTPAD